MKEKEAILKTEVYNRELKGKVCKRKNIYILNKNLRFFALHTIKTKQIIISIWLH